MKIPTKKFFEETYGFTPEQEANLQEHMAKWYLSTMRCTPAHRRIHFKQELVRCMLIDLARERKVTVLNAQETVSA